LLLDHIYANFPNITSLQYVINAKPNDTIYDQHVILYKGRDYILEEMEGLQFSINAKSFYQTNSHQATNSTKSRANSPDLPETKLFMICTPEPEPSRNSFLKMPKKSLV
jgi:23S rRNA (uracil1939-C5)-methyltransferase